MSSALDDLLTPRLEEEPDTNKWVGEWVMYWLFAEETDAE